MWLLLLSLLMLTACGNGNDQAGAQNNLSIEPVTHTIVIENMTFNPDTLTANKGDTVRWINKDIFSHDVTNETDMKLTSGLFETNQRYEVVIVEEFNYLCLIHPSMKGTIFVK